MKTIFTIIAAICLSTTSILAQTPAQFKYQAVLRDADGQILTSPADITIKIYDVITGGVALYAETHPGVIPNDWGVINLNIGSLESLDGINWSNGTYFIGITIGTGEELGRSQLLSVPYALMSKEVENVDYSQISNTPFIPTDLSDLTDNTDLLFSGNYNDLTNLPNLFDGQYGSLSGLPTLFSGSFTDLSNKPTTIAGYGITDAFDGQYGSLSGLPTLFSGSFTDLSNKPSTIVGYGITDAFDGQYSSLSGLPTLFSGSFTDLSNKPTTIAGYGITDAFDGTWASLTGKPTFATVVTSGSYNDLSDKPTIPTAADGSETKLTAGTNVTITGSGTTANPYVINASNCSASHYVGELYGGGVVFWVDNTGQHGLIASMIDLNTAHAWSNVSSTLIGVTAQSDWNGTGNTSAIILQSGHTGSAAKLCDDYTNADYGTGIYSDWYLPSRGELNHLWNNLYEVQKALDNDGNGSTTTISKTSYWASSEYNSSSAFHFNFLNGNTGFNGKVSSVYIRAVRAF